MVYYLFNRWVKTLLFVKIGYNESWYLCIDIVRWRNGVYVLEIEHINDDTIRVRIENADLEARGYTFLDLLGNQKHIETFFYSILEEVDIDDEFQESDAVTFQVMPSRNGLELFISKNADIHENFLTGGDFSSDFENPYSNLDYSRFEKQQDPYDKKEEWTLQSQDSESESHEFVIEFKHFEQIVQLARVFQTDTGLTSLYQLEDKYYMEFFLIDDEFSTRTPKEDLAIVLEFGLESNITSEILAEHGKLLIEDVALETINHHFN